jgi:hypothetical protein
VGDGDHDQGDEEPEPVASSTGTIQDQAGRTAGTLVEARLREAGVRGTTSQWWRRNPG